MDENEDEEIIALQSTVSISINDDIITMEEMNTAVKNMKKGGYDYSLDVLFLVMSCLSMYLLKLLNIMFFFKYTYIVYINNDTKERQYEFSH